MGHVSLLWLLCSPAFAADLHVGTGQPYATVGAAVAAAQNGDVLRIHAGTYTEAVDLLDLDVVVEGVDPRDDVVLQSIGGTNGFFLVRGASTVTLRGLTIDGQGAHRTVLVEDTAFVTLTDMVHRNGQSNQPRGGCLHVHQDASAVVEGVVFDGCDADQEGGGAYAHGDATMAIDSSTFTSNTAGRRGGAISCAEAANCTVYASTFVGNTSGDGGAIDADIEGFKVVASLFADNVASGDGGGVYAQGLVDLQDNVFCENTAAQGGGIAMASSGAVINNTFVANVSSGPGAALHADGNTEFANNLVLSNVGTGGTVHGPTSTAIRYSWFHLNQAVDHDVLNVGTGVTAGIDPELVDYRIGDCVGSDFSLAPTSPLRDAGDPDPLYNDLDGTQADIGAYEPDFGGSDGELCYVDLDGDGYGDGTAPATTPDCSGPQEAGVDGDCDDTDADVSPDGVEVCDPDDRDEDCSGAADNDDPAATGTVLLYVDDDGDGYGAGAGVLGCDPDDGLVADPGDCDDTDRLVNPDATEVCDPDDVDEDCDGLSDDADPSVEGQQAVPVDGDGDGFAGSGTTLACEAPLLQPGFDCDDTLAHVNPDGTEVCDDADVDEDCDGAADDDDDDVPRQLAYVDGDGDGHGDPDQPTESGCELPEGLSTLADDCDDADLGAYPGAPETAGDGIDQNCNGADLVVAYGSGGGCGCTGAPLGSGGWGLLLIGALARRRGRTER